MLSKRIKILALSAFFALSGCSPKQKVVEGEPAEKRVTEAFEETKDKGADLFNKAKDYITEEGPKLVDKVKNYLDEDPDGYIGKVKGLFGETSTASVTLEGYEVPEYTGELVAVVNDNKTYFEDSELTKETYEKYMDLDMLGRTQQADALLNVSMKPTEARGDISKVLPSGWLLTDPVTRQVILQDGKPISNNKSKEELGGAIDSNWLYNRSHLIGFQLTGQNENFRNLITGTRDFNVKGMLPYENLVNDFIEESANNYVRYRVTPAYVDDNLLASGVFIEAKGYGDSELEFFVFIHNVQEGVELNYYDGTVKEVKND